MTPQEVGDFLDVSRETLQKLSAFVALLEKWQRRINLVSKGSLADVWQRHVFDSGQLAKYVPKHAETILDVGSGAGFPGLILSIIGPWKVQLIESDQRKAVFL
jgi:16S rRNA (guanine527-N7)-methyltransferase